MSRFQNLKLINNSVSSSNIFDNIVAFYNFNGNTLDSTGQRTALIPQSRCAFTYTTGINGTSAVRFSNHGGCFQGAGFFCPDNVWDLYSGSTKASFAFWFKYFQNIPLINPYQSNCGMAFFGNDFGRFGFGVSPNDGVNNRISCYIAANASGGARYTDPTPIVLNEWNHIAGTYDNATRNFRIYRNGNLVHNHTFSSAIIAPIQNYQGFGINSSGVGTYLPYTNNAEYGIPIIMDSVGLWNRVLTEQEISFLYKAKFQYGTNLLTDFKLKTFQDPFDRNDSDMIYWLRTDYGLTTTNSNYISSWLDYSSANNHCNPSYFGGARIEGFVNNKPYIWTDRNPSNNTFYRIDNPNRTSNSDNVLSLIAVYKTNDDISFYGFTENGPVTFGNDNDPWGSTRGFGFDEFNVKFGGGFGNGQPGFGLQLKGPSTFVAPLSYFQTNTIYTFVVQYFENINSATVHINGQQYGEAINLTYGFYSPKKITEWISGGLNPNYSAADGGLFEVLAFRRALSIHEIANFQNYVNRKYYNLPPLPTPTPTPTHTVTPTIVTPTPTQTLTPTPFDGGFRDQFDPINWTLDSGLGSGSVNTTGAPIFIVLTGSDTDSGDNIFTDYTILAPASGIISFNWSYQTTDDDPSWDTFGYIKSGSYTQLTSDIGDLDQTGTASFTVSANEQFGFRVNSLDDINGSASVTISYFQFQPPLPKPTPTPTPTITPTI